MKREESVREMKIHQSHERSILSDSEEPMHVRLLTSRNGGRMLERRGRGVDVRTTTSALRRPLFRDDDGELLLAASQQAQGDDCANRVLGEHFQQVVDAGQASSP